jgi:hypothetical protein
MYCGRTGDLEGAVGFYRSVLEHGGTVYANSFVAVLTAYAEKVNSVLYKICTVLKMLTNQEIVVIATFSSKKYHSFCYFSFRFPFSRL